MFDTFSYWLGRKAGQQEGGGSTPTLTTKDITENGIYNASADGADGYSSVTVEVGGSGEPPVVLASQSGTGIHSISHPNYVVPPSGDPWVSFFFYTALDNGDIDYTSVAQVASQGQTIYAALNADVTGWTDEYTLQFSLYLHNPNNFVWLEDMSAAQYMTYGEYKQNGYATITVPETDGVAPILVACVTVPGEDG